MDPADVPDYYDFIKNPMDLGTVKSKLEQGVYPTPDAMLQDVDQIWKNCQTYNNPGEYAYKLGVDCQAKFAQEWHAAGLPPKGADGGLGAGLGAGLGGHAIQPGGFAYHVPGAGVRLEQRQQPIAMGSLPPLAGLMPPPPLMHAQPPPLHAPLPMPAPLAPAPPPMPAPPPDWQGRAIQVVDTVMQLDDAVDFCEPVPASVSGYHQAIHYPMDLGTVRAKLMAGRYQHPQQVLSDVGYVWSNCATFNEPDSDIVACAEQCKLVFDRSWQESGL